MRLYLHRKEGESRPGMSSGKKDFPSIGFSVAEVYTGKGGNPSLSTVQLVQERSQKVRASHTGPGSPWVQHFLGNMGQPKAVKNVI